jgi:putative membrane protein
MMWWYGYPSWGGGWWPFHFVGMGLFLVLIALLVLALTRPGRTEPRTSAGDGRSSALTILEERYARGEVGRDEYLEKKRDLATTPGR